MTLEALKQAEKRAVGIKQTEKAVVKGNAATVYIACDADERLLAGITTLCREHGVEVVKTDTMLELGRAGGINVKAAAAAILKS